MAGYKGYSMSNNAVAAYKEGEKPKTKWTKREIINSIIEIRDDLDFSKLTLDELRYYFLYQSSWHHTSKYYNKTYFYSIDECMINKFTQKELDDIIKNRTLKPRRDKNEIEEEKQKKEINRIVREYKKIAKLTYQNIYYVDEIYLEKLEYKDLDVVKNRIQLLKKMTEEFKKDKKTKYKTLRGYINNYLKSNIQNR